MMDVQVVQYIKHLIYSMDEAEVYNVLHIQFVVSCIPEYITVDKKNYRPIEMQSYIGLFSSGCQDFNMMTIDMLTDVFRQFSDFLLCIGEVLQLY